MDKCQRISFCGIEKDLEFLTALAVKQLKSNTSHAAEKGIHNVAAFISDSIKAVAFFTKENGIRPFPIANKRQANQMKK